MSLIGKLLEKWNRIEQNLESANYLGYNIDMYYNPQNIQEAKYKRSKRVYIKTTNQEKAILDSKVRQNEYFMEGEHTATIRTANYLYLVELFNVDDLIEVQVLKKRKIK